MALTKAERDALPETDFAVPGKRALPIHDERHVRMAWDMVGRTKDLSESERTEARHRILSRAADLGVDTKTWSDIKAMSLEAMSLSVPHVDGHPNKMPFRGVLTRLDQPSDVAPHGSGGRRVVLPTDVARAALPSLLGMAVDFTPAFDGHDAQKKIGIIDDVEINGDAIEIGGFVYAADFPDAAARIQADKHLLGFSYEMKNVRVVDPGADTLVIESCVFTGAAILRKDDAAYKTTSLAAAHDRDLENLDMTKEELEAILAAALKPVTDEMAILKAGQEKVSADLAASKEVQGKVTPHADAIRACASGMQAAGIGGHPTAGHVTRLNKMADHMEAEAALGKVPHVYRDHDFLVDASGDKGDKADPKELTDAISAAVAAAVAPLNTKIEDLKTKAFNAAAEPERKTVGADVKMLLKKNGVDLDAAGAETKTVTVADFDKFLDASGLDRQQAITLKLNARESGLIAA